MPGPKTLHRADRLLRSRKYAEVISLLESQVFLYRDNHAFYRLLGTACLHVGDFGGSYSYLQRAEQLRPGVTGVQMALAAVHLRRREVPEALRYLLQVLDREPENRRARRALSLVRTTEDPAEFVPMAESGRLTRLFVPVRATVPSWTPIAAGVSVLLVAAILAGPALVGTLLRSRTPRSGVEFIDRGELPESLTDYEGEFRYVYSEVEISRLVRQVGDLFNGFRDNLARREANRILLSNASPLVKERIRLVASYFRTPTFVDFRDNFTYAEVAAEPWLHDGCYVRWRGQTSNIDAGADAIRFVLLVGYEDERVLEGTARVVVPFTADVQPGAVELIGRIEHDRGAFTLTATSIRRVVAQGSR